MRPGTRSPAAPKSRRAVIGANCYIERTPPFRPTAVRALDPPARWALDETGLQALAGVRAERGIYPVAGALRIEVVPTYLRDANGEVIRQIG